MTGEDAMGKNETQEIPSELQETRIFSVRVTGHWHELSRKLECPSLEILKSHLNIVLGNRF